MFGVVVFWFFANHLIVGTAIQKPVFLHYNIQPFCCLFIFTLLCVISVCFSVLCDASHPTREISAEKVFCISNCFFVCLFLVVLHDAANPTRKMSTGTNFCISDVFFE